MGPSPGWAHASERELKNFIVTVSNRALRNVEPLVNAAPLERNRFLSRGVADWGQLEHCAYGLAHISKEIGWHGSCGWPG